MSSVVLQIDLSSFSLEVLEMCLGKIIGKLLLFDIRNGVDVLELPLSVPVLVEQVVVAPQLLGHLANQM